MPKRLTNQELFATITIAISKGPNFYQLDLTDAEGKQRCLLTEEFDMSDKKAHRGVLMGLTSIVAYLISKKVWPEHTLIYSEPVATSNGMRQTVVGWPEDLTPEQRKQYHVKSYA